jgi:hypothetical protein
MYAVPVPLSTHQSHSVWAVISGPLSQRRYSGGATLGDQALQHLHGPLSVDAAADQHLERFAGELVHDVEQLDHPTVGGLVELIIRDLG